MDGVAKFREEVNDSEAMGGYVSGWLDGLLWMLANGEEQAQHLTNHLTDGDLAPHWSLAVASMRVAFRDHPDIWSYMRDGVAEVAELKALRPPCEPPPGPHLGRKWLTPPSPN